MSPANSKRGNVEDPSPRSRKRPRGSVKEEEAPETPRFDLSGPSSPATGMGMPLPPPQGGQPYRPSTSPMPQDPASRGAFEALQHNQNRMVTQQQQGDEYGNGNGNGGGPPNGTISRPGSSASNYLNLSAYTSNGSSNNNNHNIDHKPSPTSNQGPSPHQHPSIPNENGGGSPSFHISLPPPAAFQLNGDDITPGGSRPFAGHPQPHPPPPQPPSAQPPTSQMNGSMDPTGNYQFNSTEDPFADLSGDLSDLGFAFDSFIDSSIFSKEDLSI